MDEEGRSGNSKAGKVSTGVFLDAESEDMAGEDVPVEVDAVPAVHAGEEQGTRTEGEEEEEAVQDVQDYGDQHWTAAVKIQSRVRGSQVRARGRGGQGGDGGGGGEGAAAEEEAGQDVQDYGDQHRTAAVKIQSRVRGSQVRARGRGGRGDDGGGEGEGVAPEEAGQDEQDAARREVQGAEEVARKGTGWFFCTQTQPRKHHLICARGCGCHHAHQQLPPACCALTRLSLSPNPLLSCRKRMRPCLTSAASLLRHGMAGRSLSHMRGVEKAQATQARAWPRRRTATASPRTAEKTRLGLDPPPHRLPTSLKPTRRAGHPFSKGSLLLTACTRARCTVPPPGQQECPAEEWAYCQIQENGQEEPANRARAGAGNKQERESSPSSRE